MKFLFNWLKSYTKYVLNTQMEMLNVDSMISYSFIFFLLKKIIQENEEKKTGGKNENIKKEKEFCGEL